MSQSKDPLVPELLSAFVSRSSARRTFRPSGLRAIVATGAVLSVAGGTAFAAGLWQPEVGSPAHGPVSVTRSAAPVEQSGRLGVLRRSQEARDREPRVEAVLGRLYPDYQSGVRVDQVRFLGDFPSGDFAALIPSESAGYDDAARGESKKSDALCLVLGFASDGGDPDEINASAKCGDTADLNAGRIQLGAPAGGVLTGLVPDAVAVVSAELRGGEPVRSRVSENVYQLDAPGDGAFRSAAIVWYDRDGLPIPR